MPTPKIPSVLTDLARDRIALNTLVVASLALLAAGLAPRVLSPGLATVQSAVRSNDASQVLILLGSVLAAGMFLVGGVLGDADGRKRIILTAIGLPQFGALVGGLSALDSSAYAVAYRDAVRSVTLSTGVVTLVSAPIVAILLGRRDPLGSVWEHEDERETSTPSVITG